MAYSFNFYVLVQVNCICDFIKKHYKLVKTLDYQLSANKPSSKLYARFREELRGLW